MNEPKHLSANAVLLRPYMIVRVEGLRGLWVVRKLEETTVRLYDPITFTETRAKPGLIYVHTPSDYTATGRELD